MIYVKHLGHGKPSNECQLSSFATMSHELHSFFLKRTSCNSFSKYPPKCTGELNIGEVQLVPLNICCLNIDENKSFLQSCNILSEIRNLLSMDRTWVKQYNSHSR